MPDREKVIFDIERCICHVPDACRDCSHYKHGEYLDCMEELLKDALAMLKEQEAVEPRRIDGKRNHFIKCGNCNYDLLTGYLFCPHCGKAVKWDG